MQFILTACNYNSIKNTMSPCFGSKSSEYLKKLHKLLLSVSVVRREVKGVHCFTIKSCSSLLQQKKIATANRFYAFKPTHIGAAYDKSQKMLMLIFPGGHLSFQGTGLCHSNHKNTTHKSRQIPEKYTHKSGKFSENYTLKSGNSENAHQ